MVPVGALSLLGCHGGDPPVAAHDPPELTCQSDDDCGAIEICGDENTCVTAAAYDTGYSQNESTLEIVNSTDSALVHWAWWSYYAHGSYGFDEGDFHLEPDESASLRVPVETYYVAVVAEGGACTSDYVNIEAGQVTSWYAQVLAGTWSFYYCYF